MAETHETWPSGDRRPHRWGYRDSGFEVVDRDTVRFSGSRYAISGTTMPAFLEFVRGILAVDVDPFDQIAEREPKPVAPPRKNRPFLDALAERFGTGSYTDEDAQRLVHSHGQTTSEDIYPALYGAITRVADLVFWCSSHEEVVDLVAMAAEHDVCLVPYGGGTNVSGALVLPEEEQRMIVSVDLGRMNRLLELDEENLTATFEAGIRGSELENVLGERGFTCGHEPDSIELSTLGGWIATYASGMKKNRYGNIEDIVENATLVSGKGVVQHSRPFPRSSHGIRVLPVLFGSEGNLGIITRATIRIHRLPEVKMYESILFRSADEGISFMKELAHSGSVPASIRLVDNEQFRFGQALRPRSTGIHRLVGRLQRFLITGILRFDPYAMVVATAVFEGGRDDVTRQRRGCLRIAKRHGGFAAGPSNGRQGYLLTFAIAYIRDFMTSMHILGETFETTVPWSRIGPLTGAVRVRVKEVCRELGVPGTPFLSYRITQLYHTGVCIYFTLGLYLKDFDDPARTLAEVEHEMRETILSEGGSLSHHHGVGKIRSSFLPREYPPEALRTIRELKAIHDPQNLFGVANGAFSRRSLDRRPT